MTAADAMAFVSTCIGQCEAEGYQQFEEEGNEVPDGKTPDEWGETSPTKLWFVFGGELFRLTMAKASRPINAATSSED